ncbi:MAG: hypothetical protein WCF30_00435 [Terracidiphilus sp.]
MAEPQPPQLPPPRTKRFLKFFTKSEWVNVFLTAVIALTGIVGIILVIQGSSDTARIRDAAEKQAQAARDFANTAASINTGISNAVGKLDIQAGAEELSAQIAQAALRPSIVFGIQKTTVSDNSISYEVHIFNEGGSSARVTIRTCALYNPQLKPDVSVDSCKTSQGATDIRTETPFTILPHRQYIVFGTQTDTAPVKSGQVYLYTPYDLSYTYAKVRYTLSHCFVYDKTVNALNECGAATRNQSNQHK